MGKRGFGIPNMRLLLSAGLLAGVCAGAEPDPRDVEGGFRIPSENYCDQPRIVRLTDGTWVCILTTGSGHEGQAGQHVVATTSTDRGRTWTPLVSVEPADPVRLSAYAVAVATPFDRVYAFYTYNGDGVVSLPGSEKRIRSDTHGWFCYRYSDDRGATWSERRRLPMRVTACDRGNDWAGKVQMFWAIGKPVVTPEEAVIFGFTKLARYFLIDGEGWFYRSPNLLTERNPDRLVWDLLPDGDHGVRHPDYGSVQEEYNVVPLSAPGHLAAVYRTTLGFPAWSFSRDGGRNWSLPEPMRYAPGGRVVRNPRACPKIWRCGNGKYLFWFHNNGTKSFENRNPAWLLGGIEKDGTIVWSEPEIVLFGDDTSYKTGRMSYPDLVEDDGEFYIAETRKYVARVHRIDPELLRGMWASAAGESPAAPAQGFAFGRAPGRQAAPDGCPDFDGDAGFTLAFAATPAEPGRLLEGRSRDGAAEWSVDAVSEPGAAGGGDEAGAVRIRLCRGETTFEWVTDAGTVSFGEPVEVAFVFDPGPRIVTAITDGRLNDGAGVRDFGWGRYPGGLGPLPGVQPDGIRPSVSRVRIVPRALRTAAAAAAAGDGRLPR